MVKTGDPSQIVIRTPNRDNITEAIATFTIRRMCGRWRPTLKLKKICWLPTNEPKAL
jgi:hypothetical protein